MSGYGLSGEEASRRLFERGKVAATPMTGWGSERSSLVRFVFANETAARLKGLRGRVEALLVLTSLKPLERSKRGLLLSG